MVRAIQINTDILGIRDVKAIDANIALRTDCEGATESSGISCHRYTRISLEGDWIPIHTAVVYKYCFCIGAVKNMDGVSCSDCTGRAFIECAKRSCQGTGSR